MPAGLGVGVGEFGHIWTRFDKVWQVWMGFFKKYITLLGGGGLAKMCQSVT